MSNVPLRAERLISLITWFYKHLAPYGAKMPAVATVVIAYQYEENAINCRVNRGDVRRGFIHRLSPPRRFI